MTEQSKQIQQLCLRYLARREHSRKELINKLLVKGYNRDDCESVVDDCIAKGWLNDQRFAESYARQRLAKGYGPMRITFELSQKGVDGFDMQMLIQDEYGGWFSLLEKLYEKKYSGEAIMSQKEWAKRTRFLMQRGFSADLIGQLFDHLKIKFN